MSSANDDISSGDATHDDPPPDDGRARTLLQRATARGRRVGRSALAKLPPSSAEAIRRVRNAPTEMLLATLVERADEVVDVVSSRILASDEVASELALVIEEAVERHGRDVVLRHVLRRSPFLDGTLLGLLEPLMSGRGTADMDPETIGRARDTLTLLLAEMCDPADDIKRDRSVTDALSSLEPHDLSTRAPHLHRGLHGCGSPDADARFVLLSYSLFLQTFLLRTVSSSVRDLLHDE